jgi:hypothetical protein
MLDQLGRHGRLALEVRTEGDLEIDAHHTVEDTGIALGQALAEAWGDRAGVERFGDATVPIDEAITRVAIDLSGRPYLVWEVETPVELVGDLRDDAREALLRGARRQRPHHAARHQPRRRQHAPRLRVGVQGRRRRAAPRGPRDHDGRAVHQGCAAVTRRLRAAVLDYDAGNVRSARRGVEAAGAEATITADPSSPRPPTRS